VALATVIVVLFVAGTMVALWIKYPRDERAFLHHVHRSVWDEGWVFDGADDAFLLAEGEKACTWLQDQPFAWWRRGAEWSNQARITQYLDQTAVDGDEWSFSGGDLQDKRAVVAAQAWLRLCGASMELREPHNPFS
jgi:hypothetical protein